jgi:hypothetical protein
MQYTKILQVDAVDIYQIYKLWYEKKHFVQWVIFKKKWQKFVKINFTGRYSLQSPITYIIQVHSNMAHDVAMVPLSL